MSTLIQIRKTLLFPESIKARLTGVIGILVLISGSFAQYVKSTLVNPQNVITTSENFLAYEVLFRYGIIGGLLMAVFFIIYAVRLNIILQTVNQAIAKFMLILALIPMPIFILNLLNYYAAFHWAIVGDLQQIEFFLDLYRQGSLFVSIFFGLWLLPLGYLILHSHKIPKFIGVFLMLGSTGYIILFFQVFLWPAMELSLWKNPYLVVTHLAELSLMLWLLIMGEPKFEPS